MTDGPNLFDVKPKAKRKQAAPLPGGAVQRLIGTYVRLFEAKFKEKPIILPRDGAALKRMIAHAGEAAVERRLPLYLALPDDYISNEGYPLVLMQSAWNKLVALERSSTSTKVPDAAATETYLRNLRGGRG